MRVIVETTAAVAAISVIIGIVALRGPAVPVVEFVAAVVTSGTDFAATVSVAVPPVVESVYLELTTSKDMKLY